MILLDTTILVYAVGGDHPLRAPCAGLIEAIGDGRTSATTTVETVQEFVHVRARRRGRDEAARLGARYADLLDPLVSPDADTLRDGLELYRTVDELGAFDAVLAALAVSDERITSIASADRAFASVGRLVVRDPARSDWLD